MSRSYKKNPISKDGGSRKTYSKRLANKAVRRSKIIGDGKWYKKLYCSWNISDSWDRTTLNDHLEFRTRILSTMEYPYNEGRYEKYVNINQCVNQWKRWYLRK